MKKIVLMCALCMGAAKSSWYNDAWNGIKNVPELAYGGLKKGYNAAAKAVVPAAQTNGCGEAEVKAYFKNDQEQRVELANVPSSLPMYGEGSLQCHFKSEDFENIMQTVRNAAEAQGINKETQVFLETNFNGSIQNFKVIR